MAALPESLGNLTALTELDLRHNRLTALPESLGNLTALTELDLRRNQLAALPECLGDPTTSWPLYRNRWETSPPSPNSTCATTG
nr:leucine-rich repeat domain-containing protein [Streptosporangium amethystogenes]